MSHIRFDGLISHWDIDGIASAAIVASLYSIPLENIFLSSTNKVYDYYRKLRKSKINHVFILDLNPSPIIALKISSYKPRGAGITWVDHHEWHPDAYEILSSMHNVKLFVKATASCTARLLLDSVLSDSKLPEPLLFLAEMAEDDDTFSNRIDLTRKWRLLLRWGDWNFRYRVLESWIDGIVWPDWAEETYQRVFSEYKKLLEKTFTSMEIRRIGNSIIVFAYPSEKIHPGDLQLFIEEKTGSIADAYVFIYDKGVSLRSNSYDVSEIAKLLGGGGHRRAAGASIPPGEKEGLKERIAGFFYRMVGRKKR